MDIPSYVLGKKAGGGGGSNYQSKSVEITENGTTNIKADSGYDALSNVKVKVSGILDTSDANATASDMALGKSGYVNGVKVNGNVPVGSPAVATNYASTDVSTYLDELKVDTTQGITNQFFATGDKISVFAPLNNVAPAIGATANKIKKDEVICGVTGTYEGGGTAEEKDVNFYDYDGTRVYSYTVNELLALETLPENPSHNGLTAQGWNWTLAEIKSYVNNHGCCDIAQMYTTNDNSTKIHITLQEGSLSPNLGFAINGSAIVDWGDGTNETVTGSDTTTVIITNHEYSSAGKYIISIKNSSTIYIFGSTNTSASKLINGEYDTSGEMARNYTYYSSVEEINFGINVELKDGALRNLRNLKTVSISNSTNYNGTRICQDCMSLKFIAFSRQQTNLSSYVLGSVYPELIILSPTITSILADGLRTVRVRKLLIPDSVQTIGNYALSENYNFIKLELPYNNSLTSISENLMRSDYSLSYLKIPNQISSIGQNAFAICIGLNVADFREHTSIPTLGADVFWIYGDYFKIVVPDDLYEDWIIANDWIPYASVIVKASDYQE